MVLKYNRNNSNGFSLVESIIALVIVSITIGSIYFALQSNIILTQKIRDKISLQFMASNAYSKFMLQNKKLNNNSLKGESIINQKHYFYIPDRVVDGYGATKKLFQKLILMNMNNHLQILTFDPFWDFYY